MKDMKLTIALACAFALSSTFALANTVRHKPSVRIHDLHRGMPQVRSGFLHPNDGNPDGPTSSPLADTCGTEEAPPSGAAAKAVRAPRTCEPRIHGRCIGTDVRIDLDPAPPSA